MANKKRVMIVDDDPDILVSLTTLLEKNGYKVYAYDNGRDFLRSSVVMCCDSCRFFSLR